MKYLKSEHLKFKRTMLQRLIFMVPIFTVLFAWIVGGFIGFQYMTFYWWYAFLLPGTIAILCSLSHRKEMDAGNYTSIFSLPINLQTFEIAKIAILFEKLVVAALFLAMLTSLGNLISPATSVYSALQAMIGSLGMVLVSIWQIPMCLYLSRKIGIFLPIVLNTILGMFLPIFFGNTTLWYVIPHCWVAKFTEFLMGIATNGTYIGNIHCDITVIILLVLSILLFAILSFIDIKDFSSKGVK